ncbi:MAG: glycosyltransferase [Planctomycetes bacterium]|nr:glycosyltransferase [Planctomycetota bacterium]
MRILFLQKRLLFPADTGCKIRTLNVVRHLAKWHEVVYLCNILPEERPYIGQMQELGVRLEAIPWREAPRGSVRFYRDLALNVFSAYPFNVAKDYDRRLRRRAQELLGQDRFDVLVCDFVQMARNCLGLNGAPKVLFQHNVEAQVFQRIAQTSPSWLRRAYVHMQWRKMHRFESLAGRDFDAVIAVSDQDRKIFEEVYCWRHVRVIDTAVDLDHFQPSDVPERPGLVVFVGSLDGLITQDSMAFFLREVWPLVRRQCPDAKFRMVGRNPPAKLQRLHGQDGIEVAGSVPDVRPHLAKAALVVVPIIAGGGTRLKIFEAMAMGKPVVSTTIGAEGLPVHDGEHLVIADEAREFAETICNLLRTPERRKELGQAALEYVRHRFGAERVARQFEHVCLEVARKTAVGSWGGHGQSDS